MLDAIWKFVCSLLVMYFYAGLIMFIFGEIIEKFNPVKVQIDKRTETILTLVLTAALYLLLLL